MKNLKVVRQQLANARKDLLNRRQRVRAVHDEVEDYDLGALAGRGMSRVNIWRRWRSKSSAWRDLSSVLSSAAERRVVRLWNVEKKRRQSWVRQVLSEYDSWALHRLRATKLAEIHQTFDPVSRALKGIHRWLS